MDWTQIIVGVLTLIGVFILNSKATAVQGERIEQLREEVKRHNGLIDRTYKLEQKTELHEAELRRQNKRLEILEEEK